MISPAFRDYLQTVKSATTNVCAIYQRSLMAAPFAFPPLDEQRTVTHQVHAALNRIDRLASEATNARKLIDHLDRAILAKAFRGELVPQEPNDEPASVLLERIRAERAASSGKPSARRLSQTSNRKVRMSSRKRKMKR
jgi:type I restriction enzyme S subunit